jgi:hypothetical protein
MLFSQMEAVVKFAALTVLHVPMQVRALPVRMGILKTATPVKLVQRTAGRVRVPFVTRVMMASMEMALPRAQISTNVQLLALITALRPVRRVLTFQGVSLAPAMLDLLATVSHAK